MYPLQTDGMDVELTDYIRTTEVATVKSALNP
jgi:hypothetical protein